MVTRFFLAIGEVASCTVVGILEGKLHSSLSK